jgi:hypothetical protein
MSDEWFAWKTEGTLVPKPTVVFTGKWKNDLGSEMELALNGNAVAGVYRTAVGAPGNTEEFPIRGFANGDLIAFVVDWQKYGSMTAWVGQQTSDQGGSNERIQMMWQLAKNLAETAEPGGLWGACLVGSNTFVRVS